MQQLVGYSEIPPNTIPVSLTITVAPKRQVQWRQLTCSSRGIDLFGYFELSLIELASEGDFARRTSDQ